MGDQLKCFVCQSQSDGGSSAKRRKSDGYSNLDSPTWTTFCHYFYPPPLASLLDSSSSTNSPVPEYEDEHQNEEFSRPIFCRACSQTMSNLCNLHSQLEWIQNQISKVLAQVASAFVQEDEYQDNDGRQNLDAEQCDDDVIYSMRQLIRQRYQPSVRVVRSNIGVPYISGGGCSNNEELGEQHSPMSVPLNILRLDSGFDVDFFSALKQEEEMSGVEVLQNLDEETTTRFKQEENEYEEEEPTDSGLMMGLPFTLEQQLEESGELFESSLPGCPDPDLDPPIEPSNTLQIPNKRLGPAICPLCPHPIFQSRKVHQNHMKSVHAFKGRKQYKCELCPPEMPLFSTMGMWGHHITAHLKKIPKKLRKTPGILKLHPCALTDSADSVSASSTTTTTTANILTSKRFICTLDKCHIEFEDSLSLKEHEKGHTIPLNHLCPVDGCTRTYRGWGFFLRHIESCERKNLEKGREENQNQGDEMEAGVGVTVKVEPEIGMEMDMEQSDEEELGITQTRTKNIKGYKKKRHCPVEGCNRKILASSLGHHVGLCRVSMERRRQRGECLEGENDSSKVEERKPVEKAPCPVCSRLLRPGSGFHNHVLKCQRELEKNQRGAEVEEETQPRKRGRPRKTILMRDWKILQKARVPSDPISMVTGTGDWAQILEIAPEGDLPPEVGVQIQTQNQVPETTGSEEETLSIVSES